MANYFYPARTCRNYKGEFQCVHARKAGFWSEGITKCIHPFAGDAGIDITIKTEDAFRKVGCACFKMVTKDG